MLRNTRHKCTATSGEILRHQYGISIAEAQTSFLQNTRGEERGEKRSEERQLYSQATVHKQMRECKMKTPRFCRVSGDSESGI